MGEKFYGKARKLVQEFNPKIPIEEAWTPPSSWYTDPDFYSLELDRVFYRGWHPVGVLTKEDLDTSVVGNEWLGTSAELLSANGVDTSLDYVCKREYTIECN
ncbi:choline monooxygenase [Forsythia ovata]|uniref:Choline monooxygenase n=1 Tax=Forsythia ovata TaxID=205694 RepID=A0ABD1WW48_9LAMI